MPTLSQHDSHQYTKLLFIGDHGSGKTGGLAPLVRAGYNLFVFDFDNGLDILANLLSDEPEALERVHFQTFTDDLKTLQDGTTIPKGQPKAFANAMKQLNHWKTDDEDCGSPKEFGPDSVVVIDSLTHLSMTAMRKVLADNGRAGEWPWQSDWGAAQQLVRGILQMLYSASFQSNVIVNAHIQFQTLQDGSTKVYPKTLGQALSPEVGSYFNTMVGAETKGGGKNSKHIIRTMSDGVLEFKNSNPEKVPAELPLESGLADLFSILQGREQTGGKSAKS